MILKKLFLYTFVASAFFGDVLVFRRLWTYGFQAIYHLLLLLFPIVIVILKERLPKENYVRFSGIAVCYFYLLMIVMLNSFNYHDHMEYYKRNITFVALMFASTCPLIIINSSIISPDLVNKIYFTGGIAAFLTGMLILILRVIEVGDLLSTFRFQLDTIPAAWHLKFQRLTTDISERKFLFMNLKYILYNQIGLRMVWGFIFMSCFQPSNFASIIIKRMVVLFLLLFVLMSGSRESCLMLFVFVFLKLSSKKRILLIIAVTIIVIAAYYNLSGLYFSDYINDVPILNRLNILFEFPKTLKSTRIDLWKGTLELIKLNPIMGIGPNGFILYSPGLLKFVIYNADNSVLGLATAFGLTGLMIILGLIIKYIRYISWNIKSMNDKAVKGLFSGCMAYLVTSPLAPHFLWPYNNLDALFWLAIGLIILQISFERTFNKEFNAA